MRDGDLDSFGHVATMMIAPNIFFEQLFETFDKSSIQPFRNFVARNAGVTKWMIAADYCLHDRSRPNNAFVFSVIPYDDWFGALRDEIRSSLPRDIKKTKTVERATTDFLASDRRFHIAFLSDSDPILFTNGPGSLPLQIARECLNKSHQQFVDNLTLILPASSKKRQNRANHSKSESIVSH